MGQKVGILMINSKAKSYFLQILLCCFLSFALLTPSTCESKRVKGKPYTVFLKSALPSHLLKELKQRSVLVQKVKSPPQSSLALSRRIDDDVLHLRKFLKSKGYVDVKINSKNEETDKVTKITLEIEQGYRYKIGNIRFVSEKGEYIPRKKLRFLHKGELFDTTIIRKLEDKIVLDAKNNGYPFAEFQNHKIDYNRLKKKLDLSIHIKLYEQLRFGKVSITGQTKAKEQYILNRLEWKEGDLLSQDKIDATKRSMIKTDIFSGVTITFKKEEVSNGTLPIHIHLTDQKRHYVGGGLDVSSQEGIGGKAFWGHRNFRNKGEILKLQYERQNLKRGFDAVYKIPDMLLQNQNLTQGIAYTKQFTDAFESSERHYNLSFDHSFQNIFQKNYGIDLSYEKVNSDRFRLLSVPHGIKIDTTGNLLDPKRGNRAGLVVKPSFILSRSKDPFFTVEFEASHYTSLDRKATHVIAFRTKIGSIISTRAETLPKTHLFYSGGASSVRGYGYQKVGPLLDNIKKEDRVSTGGRSVFEGSFEWRYRFMESFGIVPFVDIGALSQNKWIKYKNMFSFKRDLKKAPKQGDSRLFCGAGIGARYYLEEIGPVRADIAFPLVKRRGVDRYFQFYASFGQSF